MLSCKGYGSCALSRLHRCVGGDLFHVFGRRPQYLLQSFAKSFDERELDIKQHSISLAVCHSTPGTVYTISFCSCTIQDSGVFWQVASLLRFLWLAWLLCRRALQQCRRLRLTQTQRILCFHSFPWTVCSYLLLVFALRSCRHLMNQLWSVCGPFYTPLRKQVHGDHDFAGQWGEQANKIERAMYVHFNM